MVKSNTHLKPYQQCTSIVLLFCEGADGSTPHRAMSGSDRLNMVNGHLQDHQPSNGSSHPVYSKSDKPIHSERPMRIIVVGAGASGLCFAYKLQRSFEQFSLIIYEKNAELSGTWFENKYPG
jgi:hypothetical protein